MKVKNLPSVARAVVFVNACLGQNVVSSGHLYDRTDTAIEFEIAKRPSREDPHAFALQCLWKVLGPQSRMVRPSAKYASAYEWDFSYERSLVLLLTTEGQTIIRLFDFGELEV